MDISVEKQSSRTETGFVVELGSIWIDESHESLFHVRVALESQNIADAVGICISKYRKKFLSVDADSIINPERHKKIWPAPDVNAGLLAALENIECPDCGHLLKCHADKQGCEIERDDKWIPIGNTPLDVLGFPAAQSMILGSRMKCNVRDERKCMQKGGAQ